MGLVSSRGRSAVVLLATAGITLLLASSAVCLAVVYAQSVTQAGMARVLVSAPRDSRSVLVTGGLDAAEPAGQGRDVRAALRSALSLAPPTVSSSVLSDPVVVRGAGTPGREVAVLAGADLPARVRVVHGAWPPPNPAGHGLSVALSPATADALGTEVGAALHLDGVGTARVVAVVEPVDGTAAIWAGEGTALLDGVDDDGRAAVGPMLTTSPLPAALARDAVVRWVAEPDLSGLSVEQVPALRRAVDDLAGSDVGPGGARATTDLDDLLAGLASPLLVARSSVYLPAALVVLSAGGTLVLTASLVAVGRRREARLLRARGFSGPQLVGVASREAVLLALPAAVAAPLVARVGLHLTTRWGPLADAGVDSLPGAQAWTWWISTAVAATGAALLVLPSSSGRGRSDERRPTSLGIQRAGVDLLVVVLAVLACWQLLRYGGPLSADIEGNLSVDPVLVAAPALVLLAGAVISLRVLPWAARRMDAAASSSVGLAQALGAWQIGRRPGRAAGPMVLVVLAVAVGALATTYAASWQRSQSDQADLAAGADLQVQASETARRSAGAAGAYAAIPGVTDAMAVVARSVSVDGRPVVVTAWDGAVAGDVVPLRPDLVADGDDLAHVGARMAAARPPATVVALPDGARRLVIRVRAGAAAAGGRAALPAPDHVAIAVVIRDPAGLLHRRTAGAVPTDDAVHELVVDLDEAGRAVSGGELLAVEVTGDTPAPGDVRTVGDLPVVTLDVESVGVATEAIGEAAARPVLLPAGRGWRATAPLGPLVAPSLVALDGGPGGFLRVVTHLGALPGPVTMSLFPVPLDDPGAGELTLVDPRRAVPAPVLVTPEAAEAIGAAGRTDGGAAGLEVALAGTRVELQPVGRLEAVPGQGRDPVPAGVVADLPGLSLALYEATGTVLRPDSWWLATMPPAHGRAVAALAADESLGPVTVDRVALAEDLRTDPLGVGVVGALLLSLGGAGIFAALGVGVSAVVAVRERRAEFALLRAVGTPPGALRRSLAVEQLLLLGTGLAVGVALGITVARMLVPGLILDGLGRPPVPAVVVTLPWASLGALIGVVVAALAAFVVSVARVLGRSGIATTLRFGDS